MLRATKSFCSPLDPWELKSQLSVGVLGLMKDTWPASWKDWLTAMLWLLALFSPRAWRSWSIEEYGSHTIGAVADSGNWKEKYLLFEENLKSRPFLLGSFTGLDNINFFTNFFFFTVRNCVCVFMYTDTHLSLPHSFTSLFNWETSPFLS